MDREKRGKVTKRERIQIETLNFAPGKGLSMNRLQKETETFGYEQSPQQRPMRSLPCETQTYGYGQMPQQRLMSLQYAGDSYTMKRVPRGYALIINNINFSSGHVRRGSKCDEGHLKSFFESVGFNVRIEKDKTARGIFDTMREFSLKDHGNYDAFVCCLLSHGSKNYVNGVDMEKVNIHELLTLFTALHCKTLEEKPKLFFIQACQNEDVDHATGVERDACALGQSYVPGERDFLLALSTVPGYYSYRDPKSGSWYIQSLVRKLIENHQKHDLSSILTMVSDDMTPKEQVPIVNSTLRKKVYF